MTARADLESILRAALAAVDPEAAVRGALTLDGRRLRAFDAEVDLESGGIWLVGAGKATAAMARGE